MARSSRLTVPQLDANIDPHGEPSIDKVRVAVIELDLDAPAFQGEALWNTFANKPHESLFSDLSQVDWQTTSKEYQDRLVDLASDHGLESQCLKKALSRIQSESDVALVPIAAYLARKGKHDVWIVVAKWEVIGFGPTLTHIRIWAFSIPDCQQVDYVTCD